MFFISYGAELCFVSFYVVSLIRSLSDARYEACLLQAGNPKAHASSDRCKIASSAEKAFSHPIAIG
jgi:hypothetical protein